MLQWVPLIKKPRFLKTGSIRNNIMTVGRAEENLLIAGAGLGII